MYITEIFYSIQGEGILLGTPTIFIRTTGCNLRCEYCDTKYSYENGREYTVEEILDEIKKYSCKYVCVTGGEPLIQEDLYDLVKSLEDKKYKICLETNGSIFIKKLAKFKNVVISLDIKCPSSNMDKKMNLENISYLKKNDQIKFVISNKNDYNFAKKITNSYKIISNIYFQPVWGFDIKKLVNWILEDCLDVKLGIQLHKIIWGNLKGV